MATIYLLGPLPPRFPCVPRTTPWVPLRADFDVGPSWGDLDQASQMDIKIFVQGLIGSPISPALDHLLDVYEADRRNRVIAMGRQLGKTRMTRNFMELYCGR